MDKFKINMKTLLILTKCCKEKRKKLIKEHDSSLVMCILESVHNLLNGTIKLEKKSFNKVKKYKNILRKLLRKDSLIKKQNIIIQHGGFLQYLIPAAITILTSILN